MTGIVDRIVLAQTAFDLRHYPRTANVVRLGDREYAALTEHIAALVATGFGRHVDERPRHESVFGLRIRRVEAPNYLAVEHDGDDRGQL